MNYALRMAAYYGHVKIVKLLLADPRVNPADNGNDALIGAASRGNAEIVQILFS